MPAITLAKNGRRYSHAEWIALSSEEKITLLSKFGPGYTDVAWKKNMGDRRLQNIGP